VEDEQCTTTIGTDVGEDKQYNTYFVLLHGISPFVFWNFFLVPGQPEQYQVVLFGIQDNNTQFSFQ
jgi:hypothetical protein